MWNQNALKRAAVPAALLLWSLWLASELLLFGTAGYVRRDEAAEANTAYYTGLPHLVRRNLTGFRDPVAGTGIDALPNLKGDMPLVELFFRWGPYWSGAGLLLLAQTYVAGLGLYLLLRIRMGISRATALVGSAWFALSPVSLLEVSGFSTWHGWYVPAFPLLLYVLTVAAHMPTSSGPRVAVAVGALLALGSPTSYGILVLPAAACWLFAVEPRQSWKSLFRCLAGFSAAFLLIKAPSIIALLTAIPESHRAVRLFAPPSAAAVIETYLVDRVDRAAQFLLASPPMIAVAVTGWVLSGFRCRPLNVAMVAAALFSIITVAHPFTSTLTMLIGGFWGTYRPDRIGYFRWFAMAVAGALALEVMRQRARAGGSPAARLLWIVAMGGLVATLLAGSIWMNRSRESARIAGSNYQSFFGNESMHALAQQHGKDNLFRVATLVDGLPYGSAAAFGWAYGLETADMYVTTYPMRYFEFWARVIAPAREHPAIRRTFDGWGNQAYLFNPQRSFALAGEAAAPTGSLPFDLDLLSLANVRFIASRVALSDDRLRLHSQSRGLLIYENRMSLPRYFMAYRSQLHDRPGTLLDSLAQADVATLASTAFLERSSATAHLAIEPSHDVPSIEVARYSADRIELIVGTTSPGILVMSHSYSPFWTGSVNGLPVTIFPTDHAFQGLALAAGVHNVVLEYRPPHSAGGAGQPFLIAAAVCLCAMIAGRDPRRVR